MISIILPAYNAEKYISKTIQSILNQTYKDIELLIINDGSNDGTDIICREFIKKDSRVRYFFQNNRGVSYTRNFGLSTAKGDYIMFADADDIYMPNMVERMYDNILSSDVDAVKCSYRNKSGKKIKDNTLEGIFYKNEIENKIVPDILNGKIMSYLWTILIKKEYVDSFIDSLSIYEDVLFYLSFLFKINKICFIQDELYIYNDLNENSLTHKNYKNNIINMLLTVDYFHSILGEKELEDYIVIIDSRILTNIINYIFMIQYFQSKKDAISFFEIISKDDNFHKIQSNYSSKYLSFKEKVFNYALINNKYFLFNMLCDIKNIKRKG